MLGLRGSRVLALLICVLLIPTAVAADVCDATLNVDKGICRMKMSFVPKVEFHSCYGLGSYLGLFLCAVGADGKDVACQEILKTCDGTKGKTYTTDWVSFSGMLDGTNSIGVEANRFTLRAKLAKKIGSAVWKDCSGKGKTQIVIIETCCNDHDKDGVRDCVDKCVAEKGPAQCQGCPCPIHIGPLPRLGALQLEAGTALASVSGFAEGTTASLVLADEDVAILSVGEFPAPLPDPSLLVEVVEQDDAPMDDTGIDERPGDDQASADVVSSDGSDGSEPRAYILLNHAQGTPTIDLERLDSGATRIGLSGGDASNVLNLVLSGLTDQPSVEASVTADATWQFSLGEVGRTLLSLKLDDAPVESTVTLLEDDLGGTPPSQRVGLRDGLLFSEPLRVEFEEIVPPMTATISLIYDEPDPVTTDEDAVRLCRYSEELGRFVDAGTNDIGVGQSTGVLGDVGVDTSGNAAWAVVSRPGVFAVGIPEDKLADPTGGQRQPALCGSMGIACIPAFWFSLMLFRYYGRDSRTARRDRQLTTE